MSGVTTLPKILWPLMHISPDVVRQIENSTRCVICGRNWPLNRHHIVRRGAGELYEDGKKLRHVTIMLCGSGNTSGCHGKAHSQMLHFRANGGRLEYLETDEPTKYQDALVMDGWEEPHGLERCL